MRIEINLWVNPASINGQISIDYGTKKFKFSNIESYEKFIDDGVRKKIATVEEFQELTSSLNLDKDARYAWLKNGYFIYWNQSRNVAYVFLGEMYEIPMNKQYRTGMYPHQPDISFRL